MESIIRMASVIGVMVVVGFGSAAIGTARRTRAGVEPTVARAQAQQAAKKHAAIGAFLYMVSMVSIAGFFL